MLLYTSIILTDSFAQKFPETSKILTSEQVTEVFTDSVKSGLELNFPIFRVYKYSDKSGQYYCALTESMDSISDEKDTINRNIKALACKIEKDRLVKIWELNDRVIKNDAHEYNIWFWTKYCDFKDYDKDSLIDPIIVYGTSAMNGYDDGRIKFLIYYKGQKIAIRHQNGVLDFERETQVDKVFYNLPQLLIISIMQKMGLMEKNQHAIFPHGWQTAMRNKKTFFSERE